MNRRQALGGGARGFIPLKGRNIGVETPTYRGITSEEVGWTFSSTAPKIAFTLAEVLITLGIIGVVAAMTLPTLIQNKQHRELETALKKNYSNIQNALNLMAYDRGEKVNYSTYEHGGFKREFIKYFKAAKDCDDMSCVGHDGDKETDGTPYITKKYRNFTNTNYVASYLLDDGQFMLSDGAMIFIDQPDFNRLPDDPAEKRLLIQVDVNGLSKGPNRFGYDLFSFQVHDSGKLLPMGAEDTHSMFNKSMYCSNTGTSSLNGVACTYAALTDKDYWKNLPK